MNKRKLKKQIKVLIAGVIVAIIVAATTFTLMALNTSKITVADFIGSTQDKVELWADENKVDMALINYEYSYSDTYDADIVMKQSIVAGYEMNDDAKLTITLSQGADPMTEFTLPDFTGKKEDEIKEYFETNKFTNIVYNYEYTTEADFGSFVRMDPIANTVVKRSDTITVTLVGELVDVIVPDLTNYSKSNIEAWAEANGITIVYEEQYSSDIEAGKIISISVNALDILHAGDSMTIVLSKGNEEIKVDETDKTSTGDNKSNSTVSNTYSAGSEGSSTASNGTTIAPGGNEVSPSINCGSIVSSLYNGYSASAISSSLSAGGCKVSIDAYANTPDNNPDSIDGGIANYYVDGDTYHVTVYQSW